MANPPTPGPEPDPPRRHPHDSADPPPRRRSPRRRPSAFAEDLADLEELRDPLAMRAFTHPVRLKLLQALVLEGPLTATQAADLIGETPTTCSFHFRQLGKYGFVEDQARPGGRERPWRLARLGYKIPTWTGDTEVDLAASAMTKILLEHYVDELRTWWQQTPSYPPDWQNATGFTDSVLFVTADELAGLRDELTTTLMRYVDRLENPALRPPGAQPVRALLSSYLLQFRQPPHQDQADPDQGGPS